MKKADLVLITLVVFLLLLYTEQRGKKLKKNKSDLEKQDGGLEHSDEGKAAKVITEEWRGKKQARTKPTQGNKQNMKYFPGKKREREREGLS